MPSAVHKKHTCSVYKCLFRDLGKDIKFSFNTKKLAGQTVADRV